MSCATLPVGTVCPEFVPYNPFPLRHVAINVFGNAFIAPVAAIGGAGAVAGAVSFLLVVVLFIVAALCFLSLVSTLIEIALYLGVGTAAVAALFYFIDPLSIDRGLQFAGEILTALGG